MIKINRCVDCKKKIGAYYAKRCSSCARKYYLKTHPNNTPKSFCSDCGKEVSSKDHLRCYKCGQKESGKNRMGKANGSFKTGEYSRYKKCKDCGEHCSPKAIRCKKCSVKYHRGKNASMFGKKPSKYKSGKYRGIKMRSSWEIAYAKYLDKQNVKWQYEPKTFDLGNSTYTPDFYLPDSDTYVEIKGRWYKDAEKKFKLFQKKYYSANILLLTRKELRKMKVIKC